MAEVAEKEADEKEHPRGVAGTILVLERTQDLVSVVVGVLLAVLAVVVLVLGVVVFFRDVTSGAVETVSTAELALLIAMIGVFVAALITVSKFDRTDG